MTTRSPLIFTMSLACFATPSAALAGAHGWDRASSIARTGLVAVALGVPVVRGDWRGAEQAGLAMGGTSILTYGLKKAIPETRPDGSGRDSFPSGHTSVSFAAAASLEKRYGWQAGIPAFAVASFVGLARVEAKKHYVGDVLAGAAIGSAAGWLLTTRHDRSVQWLPWGDAHSGGAEITLRF